MMDSQNKDNIQNPIDPDKVSENPHNLPYPHHLGSAMVDPVDMGKVKGRAILAMNEQTSMQLAQIREQIDLLAQQALNIKKRVEISEKIYKAVVGFEPIIGKTYHLYEKSNGKWVLSLIGPTEWGRSKPFKQYLSSVKLLADHTWDLIDQSEEIF